MVTAGQQKMRVRPSATGMKVMQVRAVISAVAPDTPEENIDYNILLGPGCLDKRKQKIERKKSANVFVCLEIFVIEVKVLSDIY